MVTKICVGDYVGDIYHRAIFFGGGGVLEKGYSRDARTGFDAKYVKRRGSAWMDNIKTWTGLSVEEPIRMTEDRDKWRKYVHCVASPRIGRLMNRTGAPGVVCVG